VLAQKYAEKLLKMGKLERSKTEYKGKRVGENLAMLKETNNIKSNNETMGKLASDLWYKEIKVHDFKRDYQAKSAHFSQLVWKSSKEVGFAFAKSPKKTTGGNDVYVVALYNPAGNVVKQFKDNVQKPTNRLMDDYDDEDDDDYDEYKDEEKDNEDDDDDDVDKDTGIKKHIYISLIMYL
jgi:hypothetical protein